MADYATAEHCMKALVEAYHLAGYTAEEQRAIAGVRYEMSTGLHRPERLCFLLRRLPGDHV